MTFVLFVEGHTEKKVVPGFLKSWLDPKLSQPVGIKIVRFEGWNDYVGEIAKKVALNLSGKTGSDVIAGIGLLDLYGPTFFPDGLSTVDQKHAWGKDHLEEIVKHARFSQHFAVHETEAWLLSDHTIFPDGIRPVVQKSSRPPESVNFDEPPSKFLSRLYREKLHKPYKKVTDGTNLFKDLMPEQAYQKCPYFKKMLDDMLGLARKAGL